MEMDPIKLHRLLQILSETAYQLRKGEKVVEHKVGNVEVIELNTLPHESVIDVGEKVDCHFIVVVVDKSTAKKYKDELLQILKDWPSEAWGVPVPKLEDGPSYIHVGGVLGDQGAAFQLFALGQVLGFWDVITPEKLGITGSEADELAGNGLVMIDGFNK